MKLRNLHDLGPEAGQNVALLGMSGVGKTHVSQLLRSSGDWYHYSVDYRIGSRYLAPHIDDALRAKAMNNPKFARLLRSDAMTLRSKYGIQNLDAMADFLGKIGAKDRGGLHRAEFLKRQAIHIRAEVSAMEDIDVFRWRAKAHYKYPNFIADCSGSFCSVVDPEDANDPILSSLAYNHILLYLDMDDNDVDRVIDRFRKRPKPIFYSEAFFEACEQDYLEDGQTWEDIDPDAFAVDAFEKIIAYRLPRYRAIADGWGYSIKATVLDGVRDEKSFLKILENTIANAPTPRSLTGADHVNAGLRAS